jgi:hypothetical protein
MVELIHHDPSDRTGVSPFDKAIRNVAEGEEALIACPYISPDYLEGITGRAEGWFLLTDVGEWLGIHSHSNRESIRKFLIEHRDRVRHVTDLHAKVVVGDDRALIGSANFTKKGLTGRTEMSVLFEEGDAVDELTEWFETLWSIYDPPEIDRVERYIETASESPIPARSQSSVSFSSGESPGTASLSRSQSSDDTVAVDDEESHAKLVQRVNKAPSPEWACSYFRLVDELLSETGLTNDDPRLLTSIPQAGTLPVTVNNRYALVAFRGERSRTEFIFPSDAEGTDSYIQRADYTGRFDPLYGESESDTPWFVGFDGIPGQIVDDGFKQRWLSAVANEMGRAEKSPYRQYHEPIVYQAVRDREYREHLIREAFERN